MAAEVEGVLASALVPGAIRLERADAGKPVLDGDSDAEKTSASFGAASPVELPSGHHDEDVIYSSRRDSALVEPTKSIGISRG